MTFKDRFILEWKKFCSDAPGKLMVALLILALLSAVYFAILFGSAF